MLSGRIVKPAPFSYYAPASLGDALDLLDELGGEATPLAGGQSLVPLMNLRLAQPVHLVDLNLVPGLDYVKVEDGWLRMGAMTRHARVEWSEEVAREVPLAHHASTQIGYPAIRHRGTVGGSIAHADPIGEWPCAGLALDARITLSSATGRREVPADGFFTTFFTTSRRADELVTEVALSTRFDAWGFRELTRRAGDFAVVAAMVAVRHEGHEVAEARIALAGAADRPVRAFQAEEALLGGRLDGERASEAAETAASAVDPIEDIHGSATFRRHLVRVLTERAIQDAARRPSAVSA